MPWVYSKWTEVHGQGMSTEHKAHGVDMGPTWDREHPGAIHTGPMIQHLVKQDMSF